MRRAVVFFVGIVLAAALVRSASAGSGDLDPSFGAGGTVITPIGTGTDRANALVFQPDGKLVAAGYTLRTTAPYSPFALVRYNADGTLDSTFGSGGTVTTGFGGMAGDDRAWALVLQPDGKLVAAGDVDTDAGDFAFALVRYNGDGSLDATFGTGGTVTTAFGASTGSRYDSARALVLQGDGKLVAAGSASNGTSDAFALARYNSDGSLDVNFGTGGKVTTNIGVGTSDDATGVVLQPDGKLVAAGTTYSSRYAFALVRYNADGSLDSTFGTGGKVTTSIGGTDDEPSALVLQPDGKLVAAGGSANPSGQFALVRYNTDGTLDGTFGTSGKVTTNIGIGSNDSASALILQPDGRLVAAGTSDNGTNSDFALARYNSDGSLDGSFGTGGTVSTPIGSSSALATALVLQGDGKLVAAGFTLAASGPNFADFALARYLNSTPAVTTTSTSTTTTNPPGSSTSTTTSAPVASTTTLPCPDSGLDGLRCVLRMGANPPECAGDRLGVGIQRRLAQATKLIDRGAGASNPKRARALLRKAAKALKKAANLAATATAKGKLSTACGDTLSGILRDAAQRVGELAATL